MGFFISFLFLVAAILAALKLWIKLTTGWCRSNVCLVGKTVIVTGANTGIGYETAADLAKRGAKVILACRDQTRGENAQTRLRRETDNPNIFFRHLDLSSLKSVRQFAEDTNKSEQRLDILVNNAGVVKAPQTKSEDGLLPLMQANHFSHFLLTNLLIDLIKKTANSRIVNVSSVAAKYAPALDIKDLNTPAPAGRREADVYARSKLCNILFTIELAKRLKDTTVTTYSLHPGTVVTDIFKTLPPFFQFAIENVAGWFFKNSLEGGQTTIYCSVAKDIEHLSGQHFHDCHDVGRYKTAQDLELPRKLWEASEELVNLKQK